jgi:hypothetical protein
MKRRKSKAGEDTVSRQIDTPVIHETSQHEAEKRVEELPTVEWGERLHSGKVIARGGKDKGFVPGASNPHPV